MSDLRAFGADISQHQDRFTFRNNLDFVILRASVGTTADTRFRQFMPEAQRVPVRGAYHYLRSDSPWRDQLDLFLSLTAGQPLHFLALDFEKIHNVLSTAFALSALAWLNEIERRVTLPVLFYTNPSTWDEGLRPFLTLGDFEQLARRELWVAQWPFFPDDAAVRTTQRPGLADSMRQWAVWQFSADHETHRARGAEFGVGSDKIDLNVFNGTSADLALRFLGQVLPRGGGAGRRRDLDERVPVNPPDDIPAITNQQMINAFFRVGQALGIPGFDLVERCGLAHMAIPESNRVLPYAGPPVGAIPNLSDAERAALRAALAGQPLAPVVIPEPVVDTADTDFITWEHRAVPGLHGPADPGGGWVPEAFDVVQQSRVRAIKVLVPDLQPAEVERLRQINPNVFILARLFSNQLGERRGDDGTPEGTGRWLANEVAAPGDGNNPMRRAFNAGVRFFELHNEPNLTTEGLGVNWRDGAEFARFFRAVVDTLRPQFPGAQFGFPGLSPGPVEGPRQLEAAAFLAQARSAVEAADFLCCHVYWGQQGVDLEAAIGQLGAFCRQFPRKRILCSEFSNNSPALERERKADQYFEFFQACQRLPPNLGAMFAYVLSWRDDRNNEGFLQLHEDGRWRMTPMAARLGGHPF